MMAYLKNPTRRVQVGGKVLFFRLQTFFYLIKVFFMKPFLLKLPKIILFWRSEFRERGKFAIWVNPRERSILEMSPTRRLQRPRLLNHFILVRTLSLSLYIKFKICDSLEIYFTKQSSFIPNIQIGFCAVWPDLVKFQSNHLVTLLRWADSVKAFCGECDS